MDKIILGMLMLRRATLYEIRDAIRKNFHGICSDSPGAIQAAIKKLLAAEWITFTEYVEKSVNKKRYSITDAGRDKFMEWLQTPLVVSDGRNMELGKLLFMGLAPAEKRLGLLDATTRELEAELAGLTALWDSIPLSANVEEVTSYWQADAEYTAGIQKATQNEDMAKNIASIGNFELAALRYGIDMVRFHLEWFQKLRDTMAQGNDEFYLLFLKEEKS